MADISTITLPDNNTYNFRDSRIGSETLQTEADTVSGAINELATSIENIHITFPDIVSFTGTAQSNVSGNCQGVYISLFSLVILSFNFTMSTGSASTSTNLFRIPTTYRPASTEHGSGYGKTSSTTGGLRTSVTSDGYVRQVTMSAATGGFGVLVYTK